MTEKVAEHFLKSGKAAEQGYKAYAGLTKLEQRHGKSRLEAACGKALAYSNSALAAHHCQHSEKWPGQAGQGREPTVAVQSQ